MYSVLSVFLLWYILGFLITTLRVSNVEIVLLC